MIETAMSIAVFTDDRALFDKCVARFKRRLPAFIYGVEDGPVPKTVDPTHYDTREKIDKHWYGQTVLFDGLCQETGRDLTHTQWGIGGLIHCAEIAWHQGIDLYAEDGNRLLRGMEFHAKYLNGEPVPPDLQNGKLDGGRQGRADVGDRLQPLPRPQGAADAGDGETARNAPPRDRAGPSPRFRHAHPLRHRRSEALSRVVRWPLRRRLARLCGTRATR